MSRPKCLTEIRNNNFRKRKNSFPDDSETQKKKKLDPNELMSKISFDDTVDIGEQENIESNEESFLCHR